MGVRKECTQEQLQRRIYAVDKQIDKLVYEFYGLTECVMGFGESPCSPSRIKSGTGSLGKGDRDTLSFFE